MLSRLRRVACAAFDAIIGEANDAEILSNGGSWSVRDVPGGTHLIVKSELGECASIVAEGKERERLASALIADRR